MLTWMASLTIPATDASGNYTTEVDYGWSGVVTPGKEGYTFSPAERTYSNVTSNISGGNYTPIINTYTISGYTGSLAAVTMTGLPGSVVSDGSGYYIGTVEYGWAGTVVPEIQNYAFEPVQKIYSDVTSNQSNQNYTPSSTIADASLVGWWPLNGNANDYSGYGNNGTVTGAAFVYSQGKGTVLDFEDVDYVTIPAASVSSLTDQVTIALWQYGDTALQPQNDTIFEAVNPVQIAFSVLIFLGEAAPFTSMPAMQALPMIEFPKLLLLTNTKAHGTIGHSQRIPQQAR